MWAEVEFQIVLKDLTTILDFHSVWYGDDKIGDSRTGPIIYVRTL